MKTSSANTLDELADRSKPANLVDDAKTQATAKLQEPNVQKILLGVAGVVAGAIVFSIVRGRKKANDLKEIQRLLSQR